MTALLATVLLLGNLVPGRQVPEEKRSEVRPPRIAYSSIYERLVHADPTCLFSMSVSSIILPAALRCTALYCTVLHCPLNPQHRLVSSADFSTSCLSISFGNKAEMNHFQQHDVL
ncbi:hypothetical protein SNOG_07452 [Parastagonospora nodorum SN15]|uniref:Secreted protein n=1 Tax=Phaeosphaeria nodorum (strain SN15 / ATCC MYA-4574 / FGSC 10173) TaxID=321614 RepID=Q0ULB2_PHANO|nr:hypothetical protein SNOG_07452 [Parastagonospora nodorum SN15]EAT84918.1 hypothetical protein SNOG_07452 [Parastagonospora nodorum SN15]